MKKGFTDLDVPDQTGRCFMVTGANTGLGFETARVLASRQARVLLACRNQIKSNAAIQRIKRDFPSADLAHVPLDLGDLASVEKAAEIVNTETRLDVLINNAGLMATKTGFTRDGFEQHFGVNHLGTFALTLQLIAKLSEQTDSRIVITSSLVHKNGMTDFKNFESYKDLKPSQQYANSKLANLLFMQELNNRLRLADSRIKVAACHPGLAATDLSRDMSSFVQMLSPILRILVNSPLQGAWPTLQAATDPNIETGGYYGPQKMGGARGPSGSAKRSEKATPNKLAGELWELSSCLTGVKLNL